MNDLAEAAPSALSLWLRTGRSPKPEADAQHFKFNPNHDPTNGRFTFGGGGSSWGWETSGPPSTPVPNAKPLPPPAGTSIHTRASRIIKPRLTTPALHHVIVNGYDYGIDEQGRTRSVSGTLTLNPDQGRSRGAQAGAGGADRLPSDDGGHYIARRFDGPTATFNYFAQNLTVNRGRYRVLEDQWATASEPAKRSESISCQLSTGHRCDHLHLTSGSRLMELRKV